MMLPVSTYDNEDPTSTARLINCYPELQPPGARSPVVLRKCPGMKLHPGLASADFFGPVRAMIPFPENNEHLIYIQQDNQTGRWSLINENSSITAAVTEEYVTDRIDWAADANSYIIVSEPKAWRTTWSGGNSYSTSQINDADFTARGAGDVEFLDNYFLFREPGSGRFFGSDVGAPTAYTSTSFATAEAAGDKLVGMKATRANLLLFGEDTIEIWDAIGGGGFPFRRMINGAIDKGCINGRTIAEIDDQVLFLADDLTVRNLVGMEPHRISNVAIERYLQNNQAIQSGRGYTYSFAGHNYYVMKFSDRCFVYDLTVGAWHERKTIGIETWAYGPSCRRWGDVWFGREENPQIYKTERMPVIARMDEEAYFETQGSTAGQISAYDEVPMNVSWTYQPVYGAGQRVFHDRLEIVLQTGVGNSDDTDPQLSLEISDDGGETWQSMPDKSIGAQGASFQRCVWENLGASYQRVYRASSAAPVPLRVMSTELQARGGRR